MYLKVEEAGFIMKAWKMTEPHESWKAQLFNVFAAIVRTSLHALHFLQTRSDDRKLDEKTRMEHIDKGGLRDELFVPYQDLLKTCAHLDSFKSMRNEIESLIKSAGNAGLSEIERMLQGQILPALLMKRKSDNTDVLMMKNSAFVYARTSAQTLLEKLDAHYVRLGDTGETAGVSNFGIARKGGEIHIAY
jgi:hypothetical protein